MRRAQTVEPASTRRMLVKPQTPRASCARQENIVRLQDKEMTASYVLPASTRANKGQTLRVSARTVLPTNHYRLRVVKRRPTAQMNAYLAGLDYRALALSAPLARTRRKQGVEAACHVLPTLTALSQGSHHVHVMPGMKGRKVHVKDVLQARTRILKETRVATTVE